MNKKQDAFLILKNNRKEQQTEIQPFLKRRKPTVHSWSDEEHFQYLKFFKQNSFFVQSELVRKRKKIFVRMAEYIPTRSSIQIKSHHQKLINKFKSIPSILQELYRYLNISSKYTSSVKSKQIQQYSTQERSKQFESEFLQCKQENSEIMLNASRSSIFEELKQLNDGVFSVFEEIPDNSLFKMSGY